MRETGIEVSAKTEEEAIQKGLTQIGLCRDEVSIEVVRRAKSGLLGLGSALAVVRLTYMEGAPEAENVVPAESAAVASEENAAERAERFLVGLLEKMDVDARPVVREADGVIHIELVGAHMGSIIGRRGETLDAIQHITACAVNRGVEPRIRVYLDAENYREKREETLIRLAHKAAEKVLRSRKNMGLDPMNAYERHVIHAALQDMAHVATHSSGSEPNRRVFVTYDRSKTSGTSNAELS